MSIVDCITSFVDGRVRLRHPALKDRATAELVCTVVGGVEGITAVQANPLTGSLLIYYDAEKLSREQLLELAEQGAAVVVISSELPEILGVCDRVYVMNDGQIKGEMPIEEASQESIMRLLV